MEKKKYWIWYPGDFELYHGMKQNFSRVERGVGWPAFWKSEGFRNRVVFRKTYQLKEITSFCVYSNSVGFVLAGEKKYPFGKKIICGPGEVRISIHAGCIECFPYIYIDGKQVYSGPDWMVEDYDKPLRPVGYSQFYTEREQRPEVWKYSEKIYLPVNVEQINEGTLYEFETELTAAIEVMFQEDVSKLEVFCGESREEALDLEHCYYSFRPDGESGRCPRCAVRFAFIPGIQKGQAEIKAYHQYVDIPVRAKFKCDDPLLNQIWEVAQHTFCLCSDIFFLDGIKRDKWVWSGDVYQSIYVNQYLMKDADINRRTLLAVRGNETMTTHVNTILDYSLYWILSVQEHFEIYRDREFLTQVYPKMEALMDFMQTQLDEDGFLIGREKDWIYIDWAEIDKEGPNCVIQILYAASLRSMQQICKILGRENTKYEKQYLELVEKIHQKYWCEEKQAYINSFISGKKNVTRHANIFAVRYEIVTREQTEKIIKNVLLNDEIPAITTPYFQFYELDVLAKTGNLDIVLERIKNYWGGMLQRGAVTFWEEYDPNVEPDKQYDMYGDRFGKSLCHAWAASPIYLLSRYFVGLEEHGQEDYKIEPQLKYFEKLDCTLPLRNGEIEIAWNSKEIKINRKEKRKTE